MSQLQPAFTAARAPLGKCRKPLACTAQQVGTTEKVLQNGNGSITEAPRSLYNTGATDLSNSKPGPLSLINHELEHEKTVVFVRHGMTTWNEQKRIQASALALLSRNLTWMLLMRKHDRQHIYALPSCLCKSMIHDCSIHLPFSIGIVRLQCDACKLVLSLSSRMGPVVYV